MASELRNSSADSATAFYEFEELDIIELDEDTIRELLEDTEEEVQDNYSMTASTEVQINHNIKAEENSNSSIENIQVPEENYNWIDAMETTTADMPCDDDLALWYKDIYSEEMVIENMATSQVYNAFQIDEVAYTGSLWQNN